MFNALNPLIQSGEELTVKLVKGPNNTIKVTVVPALGKSKVPELSVPLMLCASAEELDAGFAEAITNYQAPRAELAKQIEVTTALMATAKQDQAAKALKAIEAPKPQNKSPINDADEDDEDNGENNGVPSGSDMTAQAAPVTPPASTPLSTKTNLASLI